jgi:hypothetical protein
MGTDRIIPRHEYKPVADKFHDKCDQQNRIKQNAKGGLVFCTNRSKTNKRHWCWNVQMELKKQP